MLPCVMRWLSAHALLFLGLFFLLCVPSATKAQIIDPRPMCEAVGSRSEGWYQSGIRVDFAACAGCLSACLQIGTPQEGWYNWCDRSVISIERCAKAVPVFADVPTRHPLYPAIWQEASLGIIEGYSVLKNGKQVREYRLSTSINRAEFTKIITIALFDRERILRCDDRTFDDTDSNAWYMPYLCFAVQRGVIVGYADNTFRPQNDINFAEAATILARAFALLPASNQKSEPWYRTSVEALAAHQAIPASITSFQHRLTRGEMADMLYRLQTPDPARATLTYDALVTLSAPHSSSSVSSVASAASAQASSSATVARSMHIGGLFSLAVPSDWQRILGSGTREPIVTIDAGMTLAGSSPSGGFGMMVDVFHAEALSKPADEPFFPFLRQAVLPSLEDSAFQSIPQDGWTRYDVRPSTTQAYYVFFVKDDTAVLLNFAGEDATIDAIVASFQWTVSSSVSSSGLSVPSSSSPLSSFPSSS